MVRAVIFDLDDTLYDYKTCDKKANNVLKKYITEKYILKESDFYEYLSISKKIVKKRLGNVAASHNRLLYMQTFLELIGKFTIEDSLKLYNIYWNQMLNEMTCYDYVDGLLQYLKNRDIKIVILTDLTSLIQYRKLIKLGISGMVDVLITSEEAGEEKPSEKMFLLALEKLEISNNELIMVGDSFEKDILGAEKMGIEGVLFEKDQEDLIVKKVKELIEQGE